MCDLLLPLRRRPSRRNQPPVLLSRHQLRPSLNPRRIEQRIGRCHRYGQKHDVVVVNFLNRANAGDQRVFELLASEIPPLRRRLRSQR
jgi:hypothetical protein